MVRRSPSWTASMAAMRPDIAALPMLRAPRPEIVSESNFTPAGAWASALPACARALPTVKRVAMNSRVRFICLFLHRRFLRFVCRRLLLLLFGLRLRLHLRRIGRRALTLLGRLPAGG